MRCAASIKSPINKKHLYKTDTTTDFSFIISGHLYGHPADTSNIPAYNFVSFLDFINNLKPDFGIFLGDMYRYPDSIHVNNFKEQVVDHIKFPLFNAIGNHEAGNRKLYIANFGKTYYSFRIHKSAFIILDTDNPATKIIDTQLSFLSNTIDSLIKKESIINVFICSHKLIWITSLEIFKDKLSKIGWPHNYDQKQNFENKVHPLIKKLSKTKSVFWLSGDWYLPIMYYKDSNTQITYISSSLENRDSDAIIKFDVPKDGAVEITPISLTNNTLNSIESYDMEYWLSVKYNPLSYSNLKHNLKMFILNNKLLSLFLFITFLGGGYPIFKKIKKHYSSNTS